MLFKPLLTNRDVFFSHSWFLIKWQEQELTVIFSDLLNGADVAGIALKVGLTNSRRTKEHQEILQGLRHLVLIEIYVP